jgi:hypothetical protein
MLDSMVDQITAKVNQDLPELVRELHKGLSFGGFEHSLVSLMQDVVGAVVGPVLNGVLQDGDVLFRLRQAAGSMGYRYKEHRDLTVRVLEGVEVQVSSPYFVKEGRKRGRKKRGPNGRGCHLLLEVLGFIGQCSPEFVDEAVKLALLCPSFDVARQVLDARQIKLDKKTLRRLCKALGKVGLEQRATVALKEEISFVGRTVYIGIDGGRMRMREPKRGRKPKGKKRAGYNTPWREPKLFTIYMLDEKGRVDKSWAPLHDATLGNADAMFEMLEATLLELPLQQADRIVFIADGAEWIWPRVERLTWRLKVSPTKGVQILDYYHNSETLWELVQLQPKLKKKAQRALYENWKTLMWKGELSTLRKEVLQQLRGKKRKDAITSLNHFDRHAHRMRYPDFKEQGLPIGSGHVESAIRRVINLRIKAPGTFWKKDMGESFLFLRAQLICGRWTIFFQNVTRRHRTGECALHLFPDPQKIDLLKTGTDHH